MFNYDDFFQYNYIMKIKLTTDKNIAVFWLLWNEAKKHNIKWNSLIKHFNTSSSLKEVITKCEESNPQLFQVSLFDEKLLAWKDDEKINELLTKWKDDGIFAISCFDFRKFKLLKGIKNSHFFFIKGKLDLLSASNKAIAVVGSRKTPKKYISWIKENVPKDKIIVSGLAYGADTFAHLNAIDNNQEIIVFPGVDIYELKPKDIEKRKIINYALTNGLIISDRFPGSKVFDKSIFLKRNKWMAQISIDTYAPYFKGQSGTLGQLRETAILNKKIYIPKDVYDTNINFLRERNNFEMIIVNMKVR